MRKTGQIPSLTDAIKNTANQITSHNDSSRRYAQISALKINSNDPWGERSIPPLMKRIAHYASSPERNNVWAKTAQALPSASGVNVTAPNFYTPFTTPSAFQIPNTRKEIYLWSEWFKDREPKVAAGIEFYTDFPFSKFELDCSNSVVKKYFENMTKRLNFSKYLPLVSFHYHLFGDCFVMSSIDCQKCHGLNTTEDNEICDHAGATWKSISILDANNIEVTPAMHDQPPDYFMSITDEMTKIIKEGANNKHYKNIPDKIKKLILSQQPILLDPITIYHFKRGASANQPYGVSIVMRLFQTLAYKDKLRQAQWLVAERHILPIKIVNIGSEERPASDEDIEAAQDELTNIANDPLLTLVTHHNFKLDWYGACLDDKTLVLTENGFKEYTEVSVDEKIACYNPENKCIEYYPYVEKFEYDYNSDTYGPMYHFTGKHIDTLVTPKHDMWTNRKGTWQKIQSQEIKNNDKFLSTADWQGETPLIFPYTDNNLLQNIKIEDFLKFVGYYISEGSQQFEKKYNKSFTTHIYQNENTESYLTNEFGDHAENKRIPRWILNLPKEYLEVLLESLVDGDGDIKTTHGGSIKYRYSTTSQVLVENIQEVLLKLGYFAQISFESSNSPNRRGVYRIYWTASKPETRTIRNKNIERVNYNGKVWCFVTKTGLFVTQRNGKIGIHGNTGKVLPLTNEFELIDQELLDGLMINKALLNGEGPAYNSAQVGLIAIERRLEKFREEVAHWIEERIFKPVAEWQGFIIEGKGGEEEVIYPKIKWSGLQLRDDSAKMNIAMQLMQQGVLSAQTMLGMLEVDYDQEVERLRFEQSATFLGTPGADAIGGMGGGFAGGGMGGMMGGGMPPMEGGMPPMEGGGMPPMEGGMPGAPPPGMPAAAASVNIKDKDAMFKFASSIMNDTYHSLLNNTDIRNVFGEVKKNNNFKSAAHKKFVMSIHPPTGRGYGEAIDVNYNEYPFIDSSYNVNTAIPLNDYAKYEYIPIKTAAKQDPNQKMRVLFSQLEQQLYKIVLGARIPYAFYAQYSVGAGLEYQLDGAFPSIRLGLEADSETFHNNVDQMNKDRKRDSALASQGWTILRFTEEELEEHPEQVQQVIVSVIRKLTTSSEKNKL